MHGKEKKREEMGKEWRREMHYMKEVDIIGYLIKVNRLYLVCTE